jgi:hypothetical protein
VPTIYRLYTLCAIYRIDLIEVLEWYSVDLSQLPGDSALVEGVEKTHVLGFANFGYGEVQVPLSLDPGIDIRKTSYLSRMIQRWGKLPVMLLNRLDLKNQRYAYVGSDDWIMYPLVPPGSLVAVDETKRKVIGSGWSNEFERPIYLVEHRNGFSVAWCSLSEDRLLIQPHPASLCNPEVYKYPDEADVLGQVTGIAMRLDLGKRRRARV